MIESSKELASGVNKDDAPSGCYAVAEKKDCQGCFYQGDDHRCIDFDDRQCDKKQRVDGKNVIFKERE